MRYPLANHARSIVFVVTIAVATFILQGIRPATLMALTPPTANSPESWNIIIITIDALRADRMNVYGNARETTPMLNRFAKEAAVFENTFAVSAHTSPGILSLLTGQEPPVHAQTTAYSYYDPLINTPIRELTRRGYDSMGYVTTGANYANLGFDREIKDLSVSDLLTERLRHAKPFVAWFHSKDTHLPYHPSPDMVGKFTRFLQGANGESALASPLLAAVQKHRIVLKHENPGLKLEHSPPVPVADGDVEALRALYDECVLSADAKIGAWIDQLKKSGMLERSVIVITSDHGEELLEHGWVGHASTNYDGRLSDELLRIPLMIRFPGGRFAGRYRATASQVDLMPTIFDAMKLNNSTLAPFQQGVSLVPIMRGGTPQVRDYIFAETTFKGWTTPREEVSQRVAILRSRTQKFSSTFRAGAEVISAYDLKADPLELKDRWAEESRNFKEINSAYKRTRDSQRQVVSRMVFAAAEAHLAEIKRVMERNNIVEAQQHRNALENLKTTWGMERSSFLTIPGNRERWEAIVSEADGVIRPPEMVAAP